MNIEIDKTSLCELCDLVSIMTACGPAVKWVKEKLPLWHFNEVEDGFLFGFTEEGKKENIKYLYVSHLDEIGGLVTEKNITGYKTEVIGTMPEAFASRPLVSMDYLDRDGSTLSECKGHMEKGELVIEGKKLEPFHSVFTFQEKASLKNGWIEGKAIDPRITVYSIVEAVRNLKRNDTAVMFVFAEECSRFTGQKGAQFCQKYLPGLSLVVNCDVPGKKNISEEDLTKCIIRHKERLTYIDPGFSLRIYEKLLGKNCSLTMANSITGSMTDLFLPYCHAISLAVMAEEAHVARTRASLSAIKDLIKILITIPELEGLF